MGNSSSTDLWSPVKVGNLTIKNRFMRSPCYMNNANPDGIPNPSLIQYYLEMAAGEWGLVIPGAVYAQRSGKAFQYQAGVENERQVKAWKPVIDAMHKHNTKIVFQLIDGGTATPFDVIGERPRGPSEWGPGTHAMTKMEIAEVIEKYATAAKRLQEIGADGVQIHSAHGYLISEFLSPYANHRTDEYGGSPENRRRILKEIVDETRKMVDTKRFLITTKINANDCVPGGVTPQDLAETVKAIKGIDLYEISCGFQDGRTTIRPKAKKIQKPGYPLVEGYNLDGVKAVRKVSKVKLGVVGGFRTEKEMKHALELGADLISLGRPSINDPQCVKHFHEGVPLGCVSCSQCAFTLGGPEPVRCVIKKQ